MAVVTPNVALTEPAIGDSGWGVTLNTDLGILDSCFGGTTTVPAFTVQTPLKMASTGVIGWSLNANPQLGNNDTGLSRPASATVAIGNGTQGDVSGTLKCTTVVLSGLVSTYNGIATASNGLASEVATVDLTAQAAAIGTTTLYAVPASGAGVYRLNWYGKKTTADGVSSTLGAVTIVYTDPDGVTVTLTAAGVISAGTVATTNATDSTTSTGVLTGLPLILNCKASTNITYAVAYLSNTPGNMKYTFRAKLEAM